MTRPYIIFVNVSPIPIFNYRHQKYESRSPTLLDIWFWYPWHSSSNCATLSLHTSPLLAAFHFYFLTLVFKYNEDIYLLSKRISSILPVCYILQTLTLFYFNLHIFLLLGRADLAIIICVSCQDFLYACAFT